MNLTTTFPRPIPLIRVTSTSVADYPVTNAQARLWARSSEDFTDLISEVAELMEREGNFSLRATTHTAVFNGVGSVAKLPFGPVTAITSTTTTTDYELVGDEMYFEQSQTEPFTVVYTAGFAPAPSGLHLALKKAILSNYEDRQDNSMGAITAVPNHSRRLMMRYKRF